MATFEERLETFRDWRVRPQNLWPHVMAAGEFFRAKEVWAEGSDLEYEDMVACFGCQTCVYEWGEGIDPSDEGAHAGECWWGRKIEGANMRDRVDE